MSGAFGKVIITRLQDRDSREKVLQRLSSLQSKQASLWRGRWTARTSRCAVALATLEANLGSLLNSIRCKCLQLLVPLSNFSLASLLGWYNIASLHNTFTPKKVPMQSLTILVLLDFWLEGAFPAAL